MTEQVTIDDLFTLQLVGDPQIAPDGKHIAFIRRTTDLEKNKYVSQLWLVPTDGSAPPRRFSGGKSGVGGIHWSPDSTQIAFTSDREEEKAQIFLIPVQGGEAQTLTHWEDAGGVTGLEWSPNGTKIAFLRRETPPAYTKKAAEERKTKGLSSPPRVHTKLNYRSDGFGYWDDSFWQVAMADAKTGEVKVLTEGAYNCGSVIWSPDGSTLAFLSDRREYNDIAEADNADIYTIPADGGEMTLLPSPVGPKYGLTWSPDGKTFAYLGDLDPTDQWGTNNTHVLVLPASGGTEAHDLTGQTDISAGSLTLSDARDGGGEGLTFSPDSQSLFFTVGEHGTTRLYRVSVTGGDPVALTTMTQELGAYSAADDGQTFALTLGDATHPHELFVGHLGDGDTLALNQISDLNKEWTAEAHLQTPEALTGPVPGWLLLPPGFEPNGTFPFVLYVHGGPHAQYGNVLFHELQWLAAQGYVVAYTNPRGSKGYGEAHTKAIIGDWGGPALEDLELVVEDAIARGYADPKKLAIMGGSYGGYMTAWAVGHTDRYACAIADRLVGSLPSMSGTTDFAWSHGTYFKGNAWDDPADLWKHSPLAYAGKINTPVLIIHSDGDLRCPVSQAEELFAALRLQKKTVEFVRYPAETSHGMSRNGPPDLRRDRLERNLAWLDKYLKPSKDSD